jgi:predicted nucleic acid-binding protein
MFSNEPDQQYFIDTSCLVSLLDESDVHHDRATQIIGALPAPDRGESPAHAAG